MATPPHQGLITAAGSTDVALSYEYGSSSSSKRRRVSSSSFQTKFGFIMAGCVFLCLTILSVLYRDSNEGMSSSMKEESLSKSIVAARKFKSRYLADNSNANGEDTNGDYTSYSCHYLYDITPNAGEEQCQFARTCNEGTGLWGSWVFCWNQLLSTVWLIVIAFPFILIWLILLFRMLGSTAEDYFAPSLEMFSFKLGLPPRFAGVTLLALGNGAADVSATMNAITSDRENGYLLSLGALTGAAMFVGGIVAATIVIVADGVPCRGALVRDVLALLVTVIVVWVHLAKGEIGPEAISLFLTLYGVFVIVVLIADAYHRGVVVPRLEQEARVLERERQFEEERRVSEIAGDALNHMTTQRDQGMAGPVPGTPPARGKVKSNKVISTILSALSNYDANPSTPLQNGNQMDCPHGDGWGLDSDVLGQDQPVLLHGSHGILRGDGATNTPGRNDSGAADMANSNAENNVPLTDSPYSMLNDDNTSPIAGADEACTDFERSNFFSGSGLSAASWKAAWHDGQQEIKIHCNQVWEDIVWNADVHPVNKFFSILEIPFTAMRQATVTIPCEGYYCRGVVALSLAFSPLWFCYYLATEHDVDMFNWEAMFYLFIWFSLATFLSGLVLRYAPGGDGVMAMGASAPLALYGFIMAATWIDFIAAHLVKLLDFLGIVLHIPGPVIGLTVLAWGNSIADLTANIAMARKGLANMAMTACFAGPVFNILVGLGLGFSSLSADTGNIVTKVQIHATIATGFVFVVINTLGLLIAGLGVCKGTIPKQYGYVIFCIYTVYVITSIALEYSPKYGDKSSPNESL